MKGLKGGIANLFSSRGTDVSEGIIGDKGITHKLELGRAHGTWMIRSWLIEKDGAVIYNIRVHATNRNVIQVIRPSGVTEYSRQGFTGNHYIRRGEMSEHSRNPHPFATVLGPLPNRH